MVTRTQGFFQKMINANKRVNMIKTMMVEWILLDDAYNESRILVFHEKYVQRRIILTGDKRLIGVTEEGNEWLQRPFQ